MFHALLITHGTLTKRFKFASLQTNSNLTPSPDILILDDQPSIGIKKIKDLESFLSKKPFKADIKICLVPHADWLTLPAQNALLKTLEEPPANSQIILLSPSDSLLIPTVVSRCQHHKLLNLNKLSTSELKNQKELFKLLTSSSLAKKITLATNFSGSKDQALEFCQNQLLYLKTSLIIHHKLVRNLTQTMLCLKANVNPKLALENLFFSYETQKKADKID